MFVRAIAPGMRSAEAGIMLNPALKLPAFVNLMPMMFPRFQAPYPLAARIAPELIVAASWPAEPTLFVLERLQPIKARQKAEHKARPIAA